MGITNIKKVATIEEPKKQTTTTPKKTEKKTLLDKVGYVGKNIQSGVTGFATGLADAAATKVQKAKQEGIGQTALNLFNKATELTSPTQMLISNVKDIGKGVAKVATGKQNIRDYATETGSNIINKMTGGQAIDEALNLYASALKPEAVKRLQQKAKDLTTKAYERDQALAQEGLQYDPITRKAASVAGTVGRILPSAGISALTKNPALGLGLMGVSAGGSKSKELQMNGADIKTAEQGGLISGTGEVLTEALTGGLKAFGAGSLDDIVGKNLSKIKSNVLKKLASFGYDTAGEITEETISDLLNTEIDKSTVNPNAKYSLQQLGDTALTTLLSTVVLNAITGGLAGGTKTPTQQAPVQAQLQTPTQATTQPSAITQEATQTSQEAVKTEQQTQPTTPEVITQPKAQLEEQIGKERGVISTLRENQGIPTDIINNISKGDRANYMVITDADALDVASGHIEKSGFDKSYEAFKRRVDNYEQLSKYDIAEATLLANSFFAKGDIQKYQDLITDIAVAGTTSGQVSQATSLLQRSTPDGRLLAIQKQVNKINNENKKTKGYTDIKIDEQDISNIKNAQNQEQLDKAVNKAIENISAKIPKTLGNKLNEWRYLSMLGNPKTHLRNILSNAAMKGTTKVKNVMNAALQDIFLDESQKTRTLQKVNKDVMQFAKEDAKLQKERIQGTDKYEQGKGKLKPKQGKWINLNSAALELGDWWFSSPAYSDALAQYITSKNLNINDMSPIQLEEARQYAIDQAQEQTFRKASTIANAISKFGNEHKLAKIATDAIIPFKTTPINIAKTGIEYSPVGLIKTITKNTADLKSGKIQPSQYIDNLSKGLTGSAIALIGYLLGEMGLLTASGSDEDKEKYFQQMQGKQPYSVRIGNKTITLDWLSPSAMPLFMGAEISEMKKDGVEDDRLLNIISSMGTIINPLTELSMLQGLNKTLKSYKDNALGGVLTNTLQNYALQYIPTISGQVARTLTPERKDTTGAGIGAEKEFNTFVNKVKAKLPILANTLEPYTDQFGNKEITKSIAERAVQNFLSPAYIKDVKTEKVYDEIQKLYDKTGEEGILPTSAQRYFTQYGKKIYLTPEEYTKFNTIDGQKSLQLISDFMKDSSYKTMSDEAKVNAIENFYKISNKIAKERYNK